MYYKRVPMTLEEAVGYEVTKGFETGDEFRSVMRDIADEYNVTLSEVYRAYSNLDVTVDC